MGWYSKAISKEDQEAMEIFARKLRAEPDKVARRNMQIQFVRDMAPEYGRDRAAKMLTNVWKKIKTKEKAGN